MNAIDVCSRSFAGTATTDAPTEFEWMLADLPDKSDETQLKERVLLTSCAMAFCVHYAFVRGERGLVLQAKPDAWETSGTSGGGKAVGVATLYFHPKKVTSDFIGMMKAFVAAEKSAGKKFTKAQQAFVNGKKSKAIDSCLEKFGKKHGSPPFIHVLVSAQLLSALPVLP